MRYHDLKLFVGVILTLSIISSCSSKKKEEEEDFILDEIVGAENTSDTLTDPVPQEPLTATEDLGVVGGTEPVMADSNIGGEYESYTVKTGETLMQIAFNQYGDLYQWRKIYEDNAAAITDFNAVPEGTVLKIRRPSVPFVLERNGDPYLIKWGDTLGTISSDVYGTSSKWRRLWDNNRQLIKNPDKIYAGFTLYYQMTQQDIQQKQSILGNQGTNPQKPESVGPGERFPSSSFGQ